MTVTQVINVRFEGVRGGEAALSWGQQSIWRSIRWLDDDDPYFNVPMTVPVDAELSLEEVAHALKALFERHESLRTTCVETADGPVQRVAATGELTVDVHDAKDEDPAQYANRLAADLASTAFRYAEELPVRCGIVCSEGVPRWLALAMSHLSIDAWSLRVLREEWTTLLRGERLPDASPQPLDRARFEQEGLGRRRGEESLAYWQEKLRAIPRSMFDFPTAEPEEPRYIRLGIESPSLAVAADRVAAACGVTTATVLTVAVAAVLSSYTGHPECVMQLIVPNRHDARYRGMVGPTAQDGLLELAFDDGASFTETVKQGHMRAMATYRYGHYDPMRLVDLRRRLGDERGVCFDLSAYFNDIRPSGNWPELPATSSVSEIEVLTKKTTTTFVGAWPSVDAKAFFATGVAPDTGQLYLTADTAYLPRQVGYDLLLAVERLLVRAAIDGDVDLGKRVEVCGLDPVSRPAEWVRRGPDWFSPAAVAEVVRSATGAEHVVIDLGSTEGREEVTAYLVPRSGYVTVEAVHEKVMAQLAGRTDAIAPHKYVLCEAHPDRPDDLVAWQTCPRKNEGSGRRQ